MGFKCLMGGSDSPTSPVLLACISRVSTAGSKSQSLFAERTHRKFLVPLLGVGVREKVSHQVLKQDGGPQD